VIRKHCRAHLDPALMPKFIEMRGALPKTASGKLLRRALTEEAAH
jgi:acyl-coenzyme A synthetase/AMP-(fatty) acid ligase